MPTIRQCPKCDYIRNAGDALVLDSICPACGIVYERFLAQREPQAHNDLPTNVTSRNRRDSLPNAGNDARQNQPTSMLHYLMPNTSQSVILEQLLGYGVLYLIVFIWGWRFIIAGLSVEPIMGSFMHLVNLPFHEFGHILFRPFGNFMTILGGSLFQVALPLALTIIFVFKKRHPFAASVTLWWCGQSFIDLSPYIADASFRSLPLIAGLGEESHDWGNLLTQLDCLQYDTQLASFSFWLGSSILLISLVWGALVLHKLVKQHRA
ncbi:hypothetical protein [Arenicella xantha]|uniref:Uncharacterized protein n=1 Tax=Arenicella xantha TaxID=644221 RepID=A0A395JIT0_9GAMM|nr:hypothetical protein [Arenicella xantha]RBP50686.1 hypothetical protein DFR28_10297 [Arenicella xantha]